MLQILTLSLAMWLFFHSYETRWEDEENGLSCLKKKIKVNTTSLTGGALLAGVAQCSRDVQSLRNLDSLQLTPPSYSFKHNFFSPRLYLGFPSCCYRYLHTVSLSHVCVSTCELLCLLDQVTHLLGHYRGKKYAAERRTIILEPPKEKSK